MFPFIPHILSHHHSPLSHDYHMTCTTHGDGSLAVDHPDLGVRGELEETVVEEREWRVELQHLTLQWKH